MFGDVGKLLINLLIAISAFYFVEANPAVAWILVGVAAFLLFFFSSREAIIIYALYFSFEEIILLHAPSEFLILLKYLGDILILAVFSATFAKLAIRRYNLGALAGNYLHIPLFLFLVCAVISAIINQVPIFVAFISIRQLLRYVVLFYAIILTAEAEWTQTDLRRLIKIIIILVLIQVAVGYAQLIMGPGSGLNQFLTTGNVSSSFGGMPVGVGGEVYSKSRRLFGMSIVSTNYGLFLTCGFCLLLGIYLTPPSNKRNFYLLLLLGIVLIPLLKSYSRQSIYGTLIGSIVIGWIRRETKLLVGALILIGAFSFYLSQISEVKEWAPEQISLAQRIVSPFHSKYTQAFQGSDRLFVIKKIVPKILSSPYLFLGLGPGSFGSPFGLFFGYLEGYKKLEIPKSLITTIHIGAADIGFVAILGQFGLFGLITFFGTFVLQFRLILKSEFPHLEDPFLRGITLGFLGYLIALLVANVGYSNFAIRQISFYFWILAAIVFSLRRVSQTDVEKAPL